MPYKVDYEGQISVSYEEQLNCKVAILCPNILHQAFHNH